jgi:hypothetical protein
MLDASPHLQPNLGHSPQAKQMHFFNETIASFFNAENKFTR